MLYIRTQNFKSAIIKRCHIAGQMVNIMSMIDAINCFLSQLSGTNSICGGNLFQ